MGCFERNIVSLLDDIILINNGGDLYKGLRGDNGTVNPVITVLLDFCASVRKRIIQRGNKYDLWSWCCFGRRFR